MYFKKGNCRTDCIIYLYTTQENGTSRCEAGNVYFVFAGSVSILPTELFLMTGVIKELAPSMAETVPNVVTVVLQCLKTLCSSMFTKDPACAADWVRLLQSSVATVLDFAKPGRGPNIDLKPMCCNVGIFQVGALLLRFEVIYLKNSQKLFSAFSMSSFIVTSFLITLVHPWIIVVLDSL